MKTALTIAGSDSCGGAGIQADLKTFACNGVYGMSAITALTAQNTTGVNAIQELPPEFLFSQIEAVATDIFPDAVKTGMVSSSALIEVIADCVSRFKLQNLVVDPVMVATSGASLISEDAKNTLCTKLFPLAKLITPNIPEAESLTGLKIQSAHDMEVAAHTLFNRYGCAVLIKGGHATNDANDFLLYSDQEQKSKTPQGKWFYGTRVQTKNTHGTGCTLSSAIAANLAKGAALPDAVQSAKNYLTEALKAGLALGKGNGPIMHNFMIQ